MLKEAWCLSNIVFLCASFTVLIVCSSPFSSKENRFLTMLIDLLIYKRRHLVKQKISPLEFEPFLLALMEKEMATHSSILGWRIPWTEEPGYSPWGCKESDATKRLTLFFPMLHLRQEAEIRKDKGTGQRHPTRQ